ALSTSAGVAAIAERAELAREDVGELLRAVYEGGWQEPTREGPVVSARWETPSGLPVVGLLDGRLEVGGPNAERWTVVTVVNDRPVALAEPAHHGRWRDWLQWSNVVQFLQGAREFVVSAVSEGPARDPADLTIVAGACG